jgi:NADH-quinone oxidoreductase subunit C
MATQPDGRPVNGLSQEQLVERVRAALRTAGGAAAADAMPVESFRDDSWARLPREHLRAVMAALKADPEAAFDMCLDLTCVHYPHRPPPLGAFDVVYHLLSVARGHRIRIKVACPDPEAGVDSLVPVWKGANFFEREAYDMFGVRFHGHPDLRRILMPEEFEGWPMRKEFPYRGH